MTVHRVCLVAVFAALVWYLLRVFVDVCADETLNWPNKKDPSGGRNLIGRVSADYAPGSYAPPA
jgi:hypothetical protein